MYAEKDLHPAPGGYPDGRRDRRSVLDAVYPCLMIDADDILLMMLALIDAAQHHDVPRTAYLAGVASQEHPLYVLSLIGGLAELAAMTVSEGHLQRWRAGVIERRSN